MAEDILVARNIEKKFGAVTAVKDLTFNVQKGEVLGLIGANGAGKTTTFNLLTGIIKPDRGDIMFQGENIGNMSSVQRCRRGIGRTYQIPKPFEQMSVFENMLVAAVHGGGVSEKTAFKGIEEILDLMKLHDLCNHLSGSLSLLNRKRLEFARALATKPSLLLIDEVAGGLTEIEAEDVLRIVKEVQKMGISIVWIEHILGVITKGADRILVLSQGEWLACGKPADVMADKKVMHSYMGVINE
jgi:branched-chain amino acid transport system ATP-binding protein